MSRPRSGIRERLLRLAARCLPSGFRSDYGDDILAFHRDRFAETTPSRLASIVITLYAMGDLMGHGLAERWSAWRHHQPTPRFPASRRTSRTTTIWEAFMNLLREIRYAVRSLVRTPAFSLAFIVTIGLGIGANTAIFSVVRGVLLRPLPHDGGERIVYLQQTHATSAIPNVTFSVPEIRDYREAATTLEGIAEFSALTFTMIRDDEARRVRSGIVSGNYFEVMGLQPVLGRAFSDADDPETAAPVMILSFDFWRRAFGGDSTVIGQTAQMNGRTITIVGVLEPVPDYPERIDVLVNTVSSPHHMSAAMGHDRDHRMTQVFARLAPTATLETANAELDGIAGRLYQEHPEVYVPDAPIGVTVTPLKTVMTRDARLTLFILIGAAAFVLLIACANVANLTLTRGIRRTRELAVRAVVGAGRGTLRRLLLVENAIVTFLGAGLGLLIAKAGMGMLVSYTARFTPRATEIVVDGWVLTFTLAVAAAASMLFAFVPRLPRHDRLGAAVAAASLRTSGSRAGQRLQRSLVVAQLAVSFVLLIGAGLLLKTLVNLQHVDTGYELENILTLEVPARPAGRTDAEIWQFYETLQQRLSSLPGVSSVAVSSIVPLADAPFMFEIGAEGFQPDVDAPVPQANFRAVSPEYFATIGTPLLQGRAFTSIDHAEAPKTVIINQTMADYFFPGQDPIGRRIRWTDEQMRFIGVDQGWRTVVGVVGDARDFALDAPPTNVVYQPVAQEMWASALLIRTATPPHTLAPAVVQTIRDLDALQPIENVRTMDEIRGGATAPNRVNATLVGAFALLALLIAAVGVTAVLAFSVSQRLHEIGVRLSLGADQHRVRRMVLGEGVTLMLAGLAIGSAAAVALSRFLTGLLFQVESTDPITFAGVGLVLAAVAVAASWMPAFRASRVEPVMALRAD